MSNIIQKIKQYICDHYAAIIVAFFISIIYGLPNVWFMSSLGDDYKGVPMMQVANEDFYIARMREILDGHPMVASQFFFEYKNQYPLAPPTGEFLYAIPAFIFKLSIVTVVMLSKFILPFILFLLIYALIYRITLFDISWHKKLNAISGGLFVVLGYDLVDYRTILNLISGEAHPEGWLLWARPVHPILGAIFLISFLICIYNIIMRKRKKRSIILGSLFLALMMASYFFSWGVAISILFVLVIFFLFDKRYGVVKDFINLFVLAIVFSLPYWYIAFQARSSEWYQDSLMHSGLFFTHYPIINKVLVSGALMYILVFVYFYLVKRNIFNKYLISIDKRTKLQDWVVICSSFIIGGFLALNQQVVTGMTIWPFHFVQYTIPLVIISVSILFYNVIRNYSKLLWSFWIVFVIGSSIIFGVHNQIGAYKNNFSNYTNLQEFSSLFNWLNKQEKNCVILTPDSKVYTHDLGIFLSSFAHCNTYANSAIFSTILPQERRYHNYLVKLRLKGIKGEEIEEYIQNNYPEMQEYLFSNWKGLFGLSLFGDFKDDKLVKRINNLPDNYRDFLNKDFESELNKYKINYIVSVEPIRDYVLNQMTSVYQIFKNDNYLIYGFN